jgi:RNAse (barnase) inhibitor barstar
MPADGIYHNAYLIKCYLVHNLDALWDVCVCRIYGHTMYRQYV